MIYLWSTNEMVGARLIRWGGGDSSSHFAKYYPETQTVIESRMETGVQKITMAAWLAHGNRPVFALQTNFGGFTDQDLFLLDKPIIGKRYDQKGVLFKAVTTLIKKIFHWVSFRENKWGSKEDFFCVEIIETHDSVLRKIGVIPLNDWENAYPDEAYEHFLKFPHAFIKIDPAKISC